jgi:hypothetical protein
MGLGVGFTPNVSLIARGELNMVKTGETSRKFGNVTLGLTYHLVSSSGSSSRYSPAGAPPGRKP